MEESWPLGPLGTVKQAWEKTLIHVEIPDQPEEMTPGWLDSVLRAGGVISTSRVLDCDVSVFAEGVGFVSRVFRIGVTYDAREEGAPASLVAKLHSKHPQNDRYWGTPGRNAYEKEQRFYRDIAPTLELKTPGCYLGATG